MAKSCKGWRPEMEILVDRAHKQLRPLESLFIVCVVLACTTLCVYVTHKHLQLVDRVGVLEAREEEATRWRSSMGDELQNWADAADQIKLGLLRQQEEEATRWRSSMGDELQNWAEAADQIKLGLLRQQEEVAEVEEQHGRRVAKLGRGCGPD